MKFLNVYLLINITEIIILKFSVLFNKTNLRKDDSKTQ